MSAVKLFEHKKVRSHWDDKDECWYFSIIDVVEILTDSSNARDYWFKMKIRIKLEDGLELSIICRQLKMKASDSKIRITDAANIPSLLRIIQSIPSPNAEPFKQWLAKVGYERMHRLLPTRFYKTQPLDRFCFEINMVNKVPCTLLLF